MPTVSLEGIKVWDLIDLTNLIDQTDLIDPCLETVDIQIDLTEVKAVTTRNKVEIDVQEVGFLIEKTVSVPLKMSPKMV